MVGVRRAETGDRLDGNQRRSVRVRDAPRSFADRTSISGGIDFAARQFDHAAFDAGRRVIDVSGDGTNNAGRDVELARNDAVAKGITINGLVILSERPIPWNPEHTNPPGGLAEYYRNHVIGGPGAFVMVAEDFKSFGRALTSKLVAEIAQTAPPQRAALALPAGRARSPGVAALRSPQHPAYSPRRFKTSPANLYSFQTGTIPSR
jgi:hypothetical protein